MIWRRIRASATFAMVGVLPLSSDALCAQRDATLDGSPPAIIAHRGASGYFPEHTIEAYRLAIRLGADYVEPDLVATKDGFLIARHEPWLGDTTDIAERPQFAARLSTKTMDGRDVTDWFASDFTLDEIKLLRARQPMAERDQSFNGRFEIPTLDEIIALVENESARRGREIGLYPETKHPTFHRELGLALERRLLAVLERGGWSRDTAPVVVQSFEPSNLKWLRERSDIRLVLLIGAPETQPCDFIRSAESRTYRDLVTTSGLSEIATYADGLGVPKSYLLRTGVEIAPAQPDLIARAHNAGLFVHAYTFRNEARFIGEDFGGDPMAEYRAVYELGVDGVFSDYPDTALSAR